MRVFFVVVQTVAIACAKFLRLNAMVGVAYAAVAQGPSCQAPATPSLLTVIRATGKELELVDQIVNHEQVRRQPPAPDWDTRSLHRPPLPDSPNRGKNCNAI
jgi:hypothetical protein